MILCASDIRSPGAASGDHLVRLAAEAGFDGLALAADAWLPSAARLVAASAAVGLALPLAACPLAEGPLPAGRRLPYLAALDDSDERRAAIAAFTTTLEALVPLGIKQLVVALGEVPLRVTSEAIAHRFARAELDEDEPGARSWQAAVGERRALSVRVLDACRYALDRLLPIAERRDVTLALEIAGAPWQLPSPREALRLLDEFRDGPVAAVWDQSRMQVLAALGVAPGEGPRVALAAAARVWRAGDAVGIDGGYLPGLGDAEDSPGHLPPPAGVPVVVTGKTDSTPAELLAARARVAAIPPAPGLPG